MDRKRQRSSKMIHLALMNAGVIAKDDANSSVQMADNANPELKRKKQVRKKLSFDNVPDQLVITKVTNRQAAETLEPTSNEAVMNQKSFNDNPELKDLQGNSSMSSMHQFSVTISGVGPLCTEPIFDDAADLFYENEKLASEVSGAEIISEPVSNSPNTIRIDTITSSDTFDEGPETISKDKLTAPIQTPSSVQPSTSLPTSTDTIPEGSKSCSRRGRKRNCKADKRYIDYLSEDEDFSTFYDGPYTESDEWSGAETSEDNLNKSTDKSKSKKKKKRTEDTPEEKVGDAGLRKRKTNLKKERKQKKDSGDEYKRKDGTTVKSKCVQPNPCSGKKCGNNCESVTEEKRQQVFDHFWKLSVERRRDWLVSLTQKQPIKRKRGKTDIRAATYKYYINEGEGRRDVCLQFLAATLNINSKTIYCTVKNSEWGCAKEDLRGKCVPPNKTKPDTIETVNNFIKSLPAVPSHYCRQDSTRTYLPQEFKNIPNLYKIYKNRSENNGVDFVSEKVFRKIFTENFNIGFHVPKKDKCLKCLKFEQSGTTDPALVEEKANHETEKNESYNRFFAHKNIHKSDPSTLCASFDLEKVLNTPHGESMLLYYSRKLAVYNLCFYENGTRNVFCYYWDESDGKRGANEVASILHKYIKSVDERGNIKHLLLYCDCCPGQNRNRIVMAMIHSTLLECKNIETIQMNFLLTGHTYMPVDSVHAVIETNLKKTIIHAPSQWFTVFTTARKEPFPYEVERLSFEDFYKWDSVSEKYFKGNLTGKISKIRIATFKKSKPSAVSVKYTMQKSANATEVEIQSKTKVPLMSCYRSKLPISKAKYEDLAKLCKENVIPGLFQREYINLPRSSNEKDTLAESDIEDFDSNTF